jgi:hypothetical protein
VEIEMAHRCFGKTGEGVDGTGGQKAGAAALSSATGGSAEWRYD